MPRQGHWYCAGWPINFQAADAFHGRGPGAVFLEDVVGRFFRFHGEKVWARQFNPEGTGLHVLNDGGDLWILGLKTEGGGTLRDITGNAGGRDGRSFWGASATRRGAASSRPCWS